jgi:uncharacterized RmlC-like cupin family protein
MATIIKKSLNKPEATKNLEKITIETVAVGGLKIQRETAEPGWQWSKHIKPVVGGESCQVNHVLYVLSGKLHVKMNDGTEADYGPGDVGVIPPGHDGWNAGNEPLVWLEFSR